MKTFVKYISVALAAVALCSCDKELNTVPQGSTMTADQKAASMQANPKTASADLAAIYAQMIAYMGGLSDLGYSRHNDFGYPAICILTDADADNVGFNIGYNWFSGDYKRNNNTTATSGGLICNMVWNTYFKIIYACNSIIGNVKDPENPGDMESYIAQARAVRAFCYMNMAQLYQFSPVVDAANFQKACVPIVKERMSSEEQGNNPRKTVKEIYDFVFADLDYAIKHLASYKRVDKGYVDQAVAYGLRARADLLTGKNAQAVEDAQKCLDLSGATPFTTKEISKPAFWSAEGNSVIWANIIVETNDVVQSGIVNYPSHLSSLFTDGYTGVGSYRMIPSDLYESIPATDARKGWWLDQSLSSPNLTGNYAAWGEEIKAGGDPTMAYVNVKFGVSNDNMATLVADSDWIIMRAEEMLLIKAEGYARDQKDSEAANVIKDFVTTYRDPSYTQVEPTILDEIFRQRRIELWGEGFSFQDYMRFGKDMNRKNATNWPAAWNFNIPAGHGCLLWRIPESETQANAGIPDSANNPYVSAPSI